MKKIAFLTGLLCAITSVLQAQNEVDALRFSRETIGGTARSVAMGGAFGALGGDFSSLSINPAGIAVYRKSEFSFTPEIRVANTRTRYFRNEESRNRFSVNFNSLGYVGNFETSSGPLTSVSFGIGFNRLADYNRTSLVEGDNDKTSFSDFMAQDATAHGFDLNGLYGSNLFYEGYLLDEFYDAENDRNFYLKNVDYYADTINYQFLPVNQKFENRETGRRNEWAFSLGLNFSDMFYFGATLGIQPLSYNSTKKTSEVDAVDPNFDFFEYTEKLSTVGTGYTGKVGAIVRPFPMLRVGAAFHLPTAFLIHDEYETYLKSAYEKNIIKPQDNLGFLDELKSDYRLITPYKAIGSIGITLAEMVVLSGDVEYIAYSSMKMKFEDGSPVSDVNNIIESIYKNSFNTKLGAELRLGSLYLRGGLAFLGSPYKKIEENSDAYTTNFSLGLGFRSSNFFFDIAGQMSGYDERSFMYIAYDDDLEDQFNPANFDVTTIKLMTTFGFRF